MGVDTKAIIRKGTTLEEIVSCLEKKFTGVSIRGTYEEYYFQITFNNGDNYSMLHVFYGGTSKRSYKIDGVLLDANQCNEHVELMKHLLNEFGGYLDENDCDDEGFYAINLDAFNQSKNLTKRDLLVNKIIQKVGYDKLNAVLEIIDEYEKD